MNTFIRRTIPFLFACFLWRCCAANEIVSRTNCLNNCSYIGYCVRESNDTFACKCADSYFGRDCSESLKTQLKEGWYAIRVIFAVCYVTLLMLSGVVLVQSLRENLEVPVGSNAFLIFFNVKKWASILLFLLCLVSCLYYLMDPKSFEKLVPYIATQVIGGICYPLFSILYTLIILHWADIYVNTVHQLHRAEMLTKINKNYKGEVILEDVLSNVSLVYRLRIPFFIVNICFFIVQVLRDVILSLAVSYNVLVSPFIINTLWGIYLVVFYLALGIGFLVMGRKMVRLMPPVLAKKMKKITLQLQIQSMVVIVFALIGIVGVLTASSSPVLYLSLSYLPGDCTVVISISFFLYIFKGKRFLLCLRGGLSSGDLEMRKASNQSNCSGEMNSSID